MTVLKDVLCWYDLVEFVCYVRANPVDDFARIVAGLRDEPARSPVSCSGNPPLAPDSETRKAAQPNEKVLFAQKSRLMRDCSFFCTMNKGWIPRSESGLPVSTYVPQAQLMPSDDTRFFVSIPCI